MDVPRRAAALRTLSLEIERLANHLGDLGALASDIGFALAAGTFGRLRGAALTLGQTLTGSRFQRGFICPGGVAWSVEDARLGQIGITLAELRPAAEAAIRLFFENVGVNERLADTGRLPQSAAEEVGVVGPAARASGVRTDARLWSRHGLYPEWPIAVASGSAGDALARANIRRQEAVTSMDCIEGVLADLPKGPVCAAIPEELPPNAVGVGVVEAWRGELIHWITTADQGSIARYSVRDPSFQNWKGLAIAVRHNLLADFPLVNKSFNLSYSGNDL
jgi:Ni,Fe-hydrogenase III large subunit